MLCRDFLNFDILLLVCIGLSVESDLMLVILCLDFLNFDILLFVRSGLPT